MVPAGVEPFSVHTALPAVIEPDQIERDPSEDRQILGRMSHPHAALVLAEGHVQPPMLGVLDPQCPRTASAKALTVPSRLLR